MEYPEAAPVWISKPEVPFTKSINLLLGRLFTIRGYVPPRAKRFSLNFFAGTPDDDVALHIDHRFDQNCVVRNSRIANAWQKEERYGGFSLRRDCDFELMVLAEEARFMIAYNGKHFAEFVHRFPLASIVSLSVTGDVNVTSYQETMTYPYVAAPGSPIVGSSPKEKMNVYELRHGLSLGRKLHVGGIPLGETFVADFMRNLSDDDIGLHVSCRVKEDVVVFNSRIGQNWQAEVRPKNFRFKKGEHFDLGITASDSEITLTLDGYTQAVFPVRHIPPSDFKVLAIYGSVSLAFVTSTQTKM